MARYFQKFKRLEQKIRDQGAANDEPEITTVQGEGDTNHADCKKTRKTQMSLMLQLKKHLQKQQKKKDMK